MDNNAIIETIKACEEEYLALFCSKGREWGLFVYQDRQLPELPAHNFIRIPDHIPAGRLRGLADVARNTAQATGRAYLRVEFPKPVHFNSAREEHWASFILSDDSKLPEMADTAEAGLTFITLKDADMAEKLREFELEQGCDAQLERRRSQRFNQVYLAENELSCWLCCREGKIVGRGQLFLKDGVARISDIKTAKGAEDVFRALLRRLLKQGREEGARLIYVNSEKEIEGLTKVREGHAAIWHF